MKALAGVLGCLLVFFAGLTFSQWQRARKMEAEIEATRLEQEIRQLVADLRIPSEAVYYDSRAMRKIAEVRRESYKQHGIKRFMPYANIWHHPTNMVQGPLPDGTYCNDLPTEEPSIIIQHSFENFWENHAMHVASSLAFDFEK